MGEVDGIKPDGFDFGNSPAEIASVDLLGKVMIQRTSAGTQGIFRVKRREHLLAASFVVAKATAHYIQKINPEEISFVITGASMGRDGDEDRACGEYLQGIIMGQNPDPTKYIERVSHSSAGKSFLSERLKNLLAVDLTMSQKVDLFSFAMPIYIEGSTLIMKKATTQI
jgi:2-phosphosulfolactate phosphatase